MGFHFPAPDSDIRVKFPKTVIREHKSLTQLIRENDFSDRIQVEWITIDGGGKIFVRDDGINIVPTPNWGYRVQLHIADVPEFLPYESQHFHEALRRCFTVYRYRIAQHMLPKETWTLLSLEEWRSRPSITFEIDLNSDFEVESELRIFPSIFTNKIALNDGWFKKHFLSHWSELHEMLHYQYSLAKGLLEKRVWRDSVEDKDNGNLVTYDEGEWKTTIAYYVILWEVSRLMNIQLAQLMSRNSVDFLFSQYNNWSFRYSTDLDDANWSLTRVTSPLRRSIDLVLIDQLKQFTLSNGRSTPYSHEFLQDLAIYFNNRNEYIERALEVERSSIKELRQKRKIKFAQKSPHLLTEHELQEIYNVDVDDIHSDIETEVLRRCEHNLLGQSTMIKIFFHTKNKVLARCVMEKIKNTQSYVSFLSISKSIPDIEHFISITEYDDHITSDVRISIWSYSYSKKETSPFNDLSMKIKRKYSIAVKRNIRLEAKNWIIETFFKHKFS